MCFIGLTERLLFLARKLIYPDSVRNCGCDSSSNAELKRSVQQLRGERVKACILVIDDEESIRYTFERFMTCAGHRVITASNCREAWDRIDEGGIDLIFSDIILPDGTGIDILREIKLRQDACEVIMITAYPSEETARETMQLGASDYITKPLRQEDVLHSVSRALQHKKVI
jgi:two-component system, NtrC family, response regulator HydG